MRNFTLRSSTKFILIVILISRTLFGFSKGINNHERLNDRKFKTEKNLGTNDELLSLAVNPGILSPVFASNVLNYTVAVGVSTTVFNFTPSLVYPGATLLVNGLIVSPNMERSVNLALGSNTIQISVFDASSSTSSTYTIIVTRAVVASSNNNLLSLSLSSGTLSPNFAPSTLTYSATVLNSVSSLTLTPVTADQTATIKVNTVTLASGSASLPIPLAVGSNAITIAVTAEDGTINTYNITVIRAASSNNNLSTLSLSSGTLSPAFAPATTNYTSSVANSVSSVTVTPVASDATATIKVNGSPVASGSASSAIILSVGANVINVTVIAQNGALNKYNITITRAASSNNNLSSLSLSNGTLSPTFASATTNYTSSVANSVSSVTVTSMASDATATIKVNGSPVASGSASSAISLVVGTTTITAVVTAEDGTINIYTITVTRVAAASSNNNLSSLSLSSGTLSPTFASATNSYTSSVANIVLSITVTPITADATATIKVNGIPVSSGAASSSIPLTVGSNTIAIAVTAQDGTINTYTITVTRALSSNNNLSSLTVSNGVLTPSFSSSTIGYATVVNNSVNSITVTAITSDPTATLNVRGFTFLSGVASPAIPLVVGNNAVSVVVTAENGAAQVYSINIQRLGSSNNNLSSLSLSSGTLSPTFASATTNYTSSVANSVLSISVTPVTADPTATIKVNTLTVASGSTSSTIPLIVGSNTVKVAVTAQDGTINTYTIIVTRAASSNNNLSSVSLSSGTLSPAFASATTNYTSSVANSVSSVTVTPVASDATASIKVNGTTVGSGTASSAITLAVGTTTITAVVTAQNGTTNTYTITVTRAASSNNYLSGLSLSSGTLSPTFASATTNYTSSVANSVLSISVTPVTADPTATIKVNTLTVASGSTSSTIPLIVGSNTVKVAVTAQDGTINTYTIIVTRAASSNNNLSTLSLSSGTLSPAFASATTNYTSSVANSVSSITVTPVTADATATIKVNGIPVTSGSASSAIALTVGATTITTVVTAENGSTNTYTITVTRAGSSNNNLSSLSLSSGTLSPTFASATTNYLSFVPNSVTSTTVTPITSDITATIKVNGVPVVSGSTSLLIPLAVGTNALTVLVTAEDASTNTYTIIVARAAPASSNNNLSSLSLSSGTLSPAFASATTNYTSSVANSVSSITVTPVTVDATATIKVNGILVTSGSASSAISLTVGATTITTVVIAENGSTNTYTITVNRAGSSNNNLSSLSLSSVTLSPTFASATTNYTSSVANSVLTISVTPVTADPTATIKVNGVTAASGSASSPITLFVGSTTIRVAVTAQDGLIKTYTIIVNRAASSNADLASLDLGSVVLNPVFLPATTNYTSSVANSINSVTITPLTADMGSSVKVNGIIIPRQTSTSAINLSVGSNNISAVVTAPDGTIKTYTIIVNRAASSNADLMNLAISNVGFLPTFDPSITSYNGATSSIYTSVTVTPYLADPTATIKVNGLVVSNRSASPVINLSKGPNTITVVVTAQDLTVKTYTFIIDRAPSSNDYLINLGLSSGTFNPTFNALTYSYNTSINNSISSLTLVPVSANPTSTIKINGVPILSGATSVPISLNIGVNTINIVVTAEDGRFNTYTLIVTRESSVLAINSFSPILATPNSVVTILGSNFTGATSVSFGGTPAASFTVVSDTRIDAVVSTTGSTGSIKVVGPIGQSSLAGFTFTTTLPISFIYFNSEKNDKGVLLKWAVADNSDAKEYFVERSSNGTDFLTINKINSNNSSFQWIDEQPLSQVSYYRIKTRSLSSGYTLYSKVLTIDNTTQSGTISFYPNPIKGKTINVKFQAMKPGKYEISILNHSGSIVYHNTTLLSNTSYSIQLQLPGYILAGVYVLKVTGEDHKSKILPLLITK